MKNRSLVICDLDKTLIKVNTSFHFGKFLKSKKILSTINATFLILNYFRHSFGIDSAAALHEKSFNILFKGKSFQEFDELARMFAQEITLRETENSVLEFLKHQKEDGAKLCLLSTGPDIIVKHFGALFKFDETYGTKYEYGHNGFFSNVGTVIDGFVKAEMAALWMHQESFDKKYVLTDSINDLPLLKIATHPIIVNPDAKLRRIAKAFKFSQL